VLRVTVELIPHGFGKPRVIGVMNITNDTHLLGANEGKGSYFFEIFGKRGRFLESGTLMNFPRKSKSAWHLIARCLKEADIS
jgi:hypothetical protein